MPQPDERMADSHGRSAGRQDDHAVTDHRAPGAVQPPNLQTEEQSVRFAVIRTKLRKINWFGLGSSESQLLKQVLADYARVVEESTRRQIHYELRIAAFEREQRAVLEALQAHLARLKAIPR